MGVGLKEASPFLLLFLLGYCLAVIDGELRCYCNESGCVSTGYMCKSAIGQCFTAIGAPGDELEDGRRQTTTHGCLDSLAPRHRGACKAADLRDVISASGSLLDPTLTRSSSTLEERQLLLCCSEHMCNYNEDTADVGGGGGGNHPRKHNGTLKRGKMFSKKDRAVSTKSGGSSREDDRDLWFKAAVIAVPIAGGFILVLLVLLAVRMLRTDSRQSRRLIQIRQERNFSKSHMYISDHCDSKKHQCSLFNEKTGKVCSLLYPPEITDPCASIKSTTKPKFSSSHKNSPHKSGYKRLFGCKYKKTKKPKCSGAICDRGMPSSSAPHCDKSSNSKLCCSKSYSCCKEQCGNKNGGTSGSSYKTCQVPHTENLHGRDNNMSTNSVCGKSLEEGQIQHVDLSNTNSRMNDAPSTCDDDSMV